MKFSIGQQVVFLNEEGGGIVLSFLKGVYTVEDQDGFRRNYREVELGAVHSKFPDLEDLNPTDFEEVTSQKKIKTNPEKNWQIDLHIEELVDSHVHMTNYEIVQKQLSELRKFVAKAQAKKVRKIVVIHGVGTGVLKSEVHHFFKSISGAEYFYGDYREFGQGATVILLRYNY